MSEQTSADVRWNKKKIAAAVVMSVMILAGSLYGFAAAKVREAAGAAILAHANDAVNGSVTVGGIDLSVVGAVEINRRKYWTSAGVP